MGSHGHFHWNELLTADVERAKRFYGEIIGWTFEAMPMPDGATYWVASIGGKACVKPGCPISRSTTSMRASRRPSLPAPS